MSKSDISFVRREILPQQTPPSGEIGAQRWIRENLISGPLNIILTLLGVGVVFFLIAKLGPWFLNSVWNADSLKECREIMGENEGACFGVIKDRWHQLLFGFYPSESYWRPVITFVGMLAAIAPVLFQNVPRKLLWWSAVFPAIAFWLLWGGTIWFSVVAMLGFVVGYFVYVALAKAVSSLLAVIGAILSPIVWWVFLAGPLEGALSSAMPIGIEQIPSNDFGGFMISIIIGVTGIALSLPIGILLALGRKSDMPLVKWICVGFIEFIRGVPLITLLFTASLLLNYFLPPGTNFDIVLRVVIMVTLFAAAYMAEVVRGGFAALPRGQYEAADALGLDYWKAQRLIIMPQALKISIPGIVNTFIGLFKDTTLVVFIAR